MSYDLTSLLKRLRSNFPGDEPSVSVLLIDPRFFGVAVIRFKLNNIP